MLTHDNIVTLKKYLENRVIKSVGGVIPNILILEFTDGTVLKLNSYYVQGKGVRMAYVLEVSSGRDN